MDFEGKVIQFLGETTGTSKAGNPWKKKEWVVETFGQYPKKVKVQCFGDRSDNINLEPGRDYILSVDLESREFNGRWYTDVSVFRVQEYQGQQSQFINQSQQTYQGGYQNPQSQQNFNNPSYPANQGQSFGGVQEFGPGADSDEDLPF